MATTVSNRLGNSGAEERFIQLFCDVFGPERGQYVYMQHPFVDIYGGHRTIDFALNSSEGHIAIEIDGNQWHQPGVVSEDKYHDDLLKQNSLVHEGWQVYRWTSRQIEKTPERIKDELITFLGSSPVFQYMQEAMPPQLGDTFALHEHQSQALANLEQMRAESKTIALLYHATGTGKTVTAVSDAKRVGKRTLFLAHTKELVYQAYECFCKLWPEVSVGRYLEGYREADTHVVCGSIQSIAQNIGAFSPDDFGYLIIDECHHGTADTYQKIMSYFSPSFTLGLTATPERTDGEDLLSIFQSVAHKLDLQTAVELDTLVPVRCIRIATNIDLRDVRINGFRYNALDLESKIMIPGRNQLIVDTYCEYVKNKPTVVFCTSVKHTIGLYSILEKELGLINTWSLEQRTWYSDMMMRTGLLIKGGDEGIFGVPAEADVQPDEAVAIAKSAIIEAFGLSEDALDNHRIDLSFETDSNDWERQNLYYIINFWGEEYYWCNVTRDGRIMDSTMHKFSLSPAEQVERNRKEAEAAKAREAELPQGISDQWSLADKARFLGGSNGVPGIDDITEEEALNIALNRFADLGYDLGGYDVSVWYKLYDYFAAPTMPSPDEMNPFYVIFFSDDLAAPTKVFSIIIDADTGDIISEGAPAPSNG